MTKAVKEKKKIGLLTKIGIIAGIVIALFLLSAVILLACLFDKPREFAVDPLRPEDFALQQKLAGKLAGEFLRNPIPEEASITLSPDEVRSLIRIADNGITLAGILGGKNAAKHAKTHNIRYEDGRFEILYPVETKYRFLWGGVIVTEMSVRPEKEDALFGMDITRFRAGAYRMPDSLTSGVTSKIIADQTAGKDYLIFDRCVKSIHIDENHNLTIVYRPSEIATQFLPANMQRQLQKLNQFRKR